MKHLLLNIALAFAWAAVTGQFEPVNLLVGFGLGYVCLVAVSRALGPTPYFGMVRRAVNLLSFFLRELVTANVRVAAGVLMPRRFLRPRIIALPLDARTDAEIMLLTNLISLTPGTLSLDVSADRRTLYIHAMYASDADAVRREIKDGMERRLLALMRGSDWNKRGQL